MCGVDVVATRMRRQEELIVAFMAAAQYAAQGQLGAGYGLKQNNYDAIYSRSFGKNQKTEDLPQRAEWIGDDVFLPNSVELSCSSPRYRTAASIFAESLPQPKKRCSCSKLQGRNTQVSQPKADLINTLPDECLQEIFGFLPKAQDRCACASVSMRWLLLQSGMHRNNFKTDSSKCQGRCSGGSGCATRSRTKTILEKVQTPSEVVKSIAEEWSDEAHEGDLDASTDESHTCDIDTDTDALQDEPRVERQPQWAIGDLSRSLEGRKATDVRLASIAIGTLACGGLGKLSIRGGGILNFGKGVTDSGLLAVGNCCAALRCLTLWDCNNVGDKGLTAIGKGCRLLEKLDVMKCSKVGDAGLTAIAEGCLLLSTLNLDSCARIGDEGLEMVGKHCRSLVSLSVSNCGLVGSDGIGAIGIGCKKIKKLKIEKTRLCNKGLVVLGESCKSLTKVKLANLDSCNEEGFIGLCGSSGLQQLRSLCISACPGITDESLEKVGKLCKDLKFFVLSQCQTVTDKGLKAFMQCCRCLDSLQLEKCNGITHTGVIAALTLRDGKLKSLGISNCDGVCDKGLFSAQAPLTSLSLKTLQLTNCKGVGNSCLVTIGRCCPSLEQLDLSGLVGVTDEAVISVLQGSGKQLVTLNLTGCINITNAGIAAVAKYCGTNLRNLVLDSCCQVGDTSLQMVALDCNALEELDASETAITDKGVQALVTARGPWLQTLTLAGCVNLTDECLFTIEQCCPSLQALNVKNCPLLTSKGLSTLDCHLWQCDFEYS